jgi:hypothetical protein
MAITRFLEREHEISLQEEVTYATDPGAATAGDSFKHSTGLDACKRVIARYDRTQDRDYAQASVITTQKGRESTTIKIAADLIPSGNATTPTVPDLDKAFKAVFGSLHTATAHTTTAAGCSGVTLNLATGGWAAAGLSDGDMLAVDVDAATGYEVRQAVSHTGDAVTLDRKFTADPAAARTVKVGTTFKLLNTAAISLYMKRWIGGAGYRLATPGVILTDMDLTCDSAQATPVAKVAFSGKGSAETTHIEARPTFTYNGVPLVPSMIPVWFDAGATPRKMYLAGACGLKVNNGLDLRDNESRSLNPTGPKRTGNNARYNVDLSLGMLLTTGDEDTTALYATIQSLGSLDVLVQLGKSAGSIIAFRCPKWIPEGNFASRDGEAGITLGGGKVYGTAGDDEVTLAFI